VSIPIMDERNETVMATAPNNQAGSVVIDWLDAMRRGDRDAVAECFRPGVTGRGIVPDASAVTVRRCWTCSSTVLPLGRRARRRSK
jgi:hypothetical protein